MKILLIHPNFPAQFRHIAAALGDNSKNEVIFVTANSRSEWQIPGVKKVVYSMAQPPKSSDLSVSNEFVSKMQAAQSVLALLLKLKKNSFIPDIILGYAGWGTTFYIHDVYPDVPFLCYFEWYYNLHGSNLDFDPNQPPTLTTALSIRQRNTFLLNDLIGCNKGVTATGWQWQQFPADFREKITQLHDGIDTDYFRPAIQHGLKIAKLDLSGVKKIVTYTSRGFEPYRGFPQFIEAVEIVLEKDKDCHIVIVGSDRTCYGMPREDGMTHKEFMLAKIKLDMERVHFVGELSYGDYLRVLQHSSVHVYLTYPFVLSWSFLEAMSCGCVLVASSTPPVKEVVQDGVNGILADFFSPNNIASKIIGILAYPSFTEKIRVKARKTIEEKYSLKKLLPKHLEIIRQIATKKESFGPFG